MSNDSMTSSFGIATTTATTMAPIWTRYYYLFVVVVFVSRIISTNVSIIMKSATEPIIHYGVYLSL